MPKPVKSRKKTKQTQTSEIQLSEPIIEPLQTKDQPLEPTFDQDDDLEDLDQPRISEEQFDDPFLPAQPDYMIRQHQIATYHMLCQFLVHQDKNVTDVLNDVRVS